MRLSKIRLTGFKSFVDATPVPLPGGITAIVGPNGCGKSNIIDAVRWVMGESSARHLRGGSMADVIFSGSGSRKPVGQASIELVFDNADGALGGQYAGFSEIAVRRQVNRDGQSAYYLNGTRCRRRDITDVFLGTGLGPRSYSIIEQGTISRMIEAKPEELRGYLEEAAGISLYKERRRETERRMRDTRENLERLEDVRDEVGRQLEKLARQAETAERYRSLKAEERQRRAELTMLRIRGLEHAREALQKELAERNNALESRLAEQRGIERDMESLRARHAEQSDALNAIQARFYEVGSEIARIEQRITHRRELRESSARELERNREGLAGVDQELEQDRDKQSVLISRIDTLRPELGELDTALDKAAGEVDRSRERLDEALEARDALARRRADADREAQVERTRIEQLEARQAERLRRRDTLVEELAGLDTDSESDGARIEAELADLEARRDELDAAIVRIEAGISEAIERRDAARDAHDEAREQLSEARARQTSLQTLQDAALGMDADVAAWLEQLGLGNGHRLGEQLAVQSGWEAAVEVALGEALQAVVASDLSGPGRRAPDLAAGSVMLYRADTPAASQPDTNAPGVRPLSLCVEGPAVVAELLAGIHAADDDDEALARLAELPAGHSVVTRGGRWYGHHWLRVQTDVGGDDKGVLARAGALEALARDIARHDAAVSDSRALLHQAETALGEDEERRAEQADARAAVEQELAAARARLEAEQRQQVARRKRVEALERERDELVAALESADADIRQARAQLESALEAGAAVDAESGPLETACEQAREALAHARENADTLREQRQDAALRLESAQTARQSVDEAIQRLTRQRERLEARNQELDAALAEVSGSDDSLEAERQQLLERRAAIESELTEARQVLGDADEQLRTLDKQRSEAESAVAELREAAETARYRDYELEAKCQTQREQLQDVEPELLERAAEVSETASEADWEKELERLGARIQRLGPINLAAIDEHRSLSERKGYLDEQHGDLTEALETLQTAIQKIDRETRTRFRETFDKVNAGLQRLFPRLFGGGQAYLEMTDDDLLETGVTIMARPPGKRISNIHLLSGGEKALAAVSLVFAIFALNPAPFCMLDEVDAPLDEANVGRFCDLLREMSASVQFIVITHNKTTMEAASHLAGVTMAEPGVSRLVAVDVQAAVEMAAAEA